MFRRSSVYSKKRDKMEEIIFEDLAEQIRFPAAADSGDDFDLTVVHFGNQSVQIQVAVNPHGDTPFRI